VVDFTDEQSIEAALGALWPANLHDSARRARASVRNCHEVRVTQWSALLRSAPAKPSRDKQPFAMRTARR
jgi:hypothetical protein